MLTPIMAPPGSGLARWCAALLALSAAACDYEPVARPVRPRRVDAEPWQLLGRLDERGQYVLLGAQDDGGEARFSISRWDKGKRCDVPPGPNALLGGALVRGAGFDGPALYAPAGVPRNERDSELVLVDEQCSVYDGYGLLRVNSLRAFGSRFEERSFFTYRDPEGTLYLLDPYVSLAAQRIAADVGSVRSGVGGPKLDQDALWLQEAGRLTQRGLDGALERALGSAVSAFALDPSARRVAFIDEGALYEATAPRFEPQRLADDACAPRYSNERLEFFAPCESEALVRIRISNGRVETFDEGVFASSMQEGVQLDYVRQPEDRAQLFARFPDGERLRVEPSLESGRAYVLDDTRLAGLDAEQRFGVWDRTNGRFDPLFSRVEELVSHHRGKVHTYSWLLHHEVDTEGLGTLTVIQEQGMRSLEIARGVPRRQQGGFLVENGGALPDYPFNTPLVVVLEQSQPRAEVPERFHGRLRALALAGEPSLVLADGVSSYLLVAAPVPGLLYTVDEGSERGLWFAAL